MKVTYRREIRHNYLIIDPEELEWSGYESQMLSRNPVEGLLDFKIKPTEEGVRFCYEITSKQPLIRLLQTRKIKAEEIRALLIGIFSALERMERYLLQEKRILLDPEFLYIDPDSFRVGLCLVPGMERDFTEDFSRLLERILESVDHQDKESVVLAYGLYQETKKENYGIADVMDFLSKAHRDEFQNGQLEVDSGRQKSDVQSTAMQKNVDQESVAERAAMGGAAAGKGISGTSVAWKSMAGKAADEKGMSGKVMVGKAMKREGTALNRIGQDEYINRDDRTSRREGEKGKWKNIKYKDKKKEGQRGNWWEQLQSWIVSRFRGKQEEIPVRVPWEMMFQEEENAEPYSGEFSRATAKPEGDPIEQGTVLLADLTTDSGCRVLRALDMGEEDIPISYYPFIIGKQEHLVDYCLNRDTVSRLHLKIDRNGEQYQIQDLNSTNGTMLNGKWMNNNETNEIQIGDEISIARYRYRFE